jgi:hypothetical protein
MCSGCSGDPEDPPECVPFLAEEDASPFWALWREPVANDWGVDDAQLEAANGETRLCSREAVDERLRSGAVESSA